MQRSRQPDQANLPLAEAAPGRAAASIGPAAGMSLASAIGNRAFAGAFGPRVVAPGSAHGPLIEHTAKSRRENGPTSSRLLDRVAAATERQVQGYRPSDWPRISERLLSLQASAGNAALARLLSSPPKHGSGRLLARATPPAPLTPVQPPPSHAVGAAGEQTMAFVHYRWEDGWAVVRGPSGAGGHAITAAGEDGLAYNVRTGLLRIADNKAFARVGNVGKATAIDPRRNLLQNLDDMIVQVENMGSPRDMPFRQDVLRLLRQTRAAVRDGGAIPGRVQLVVHNEYGHSTGITASLRRAGVKFIDGRVPVIAQPGAERAPLGLRSAIAGEQAFARGLSIAGRVAGVIVRAAIFAAIVLGLDYLRRQGEQQQFERRMRAGQAQLEAELDKLAPEIETLYAKGDGKTVWANVTIWIRSRHTVMGSSLGIAYDYAFDDAGFGRVATSLEYRSESSRKQQAGGALPIPGGSAGITYEQESITYSVPVPYDPASLDPEGLRRRLTHNEADASRPMPQPVIDALFAERESLLKSSRPLIPDG